MSDAIQGLEPTLVWKYFAEIARVPRCSKHEEKIRASAAWKWLVANAERFGFYPYKNEAWHWEYGAPHDSTGATYRREIAEGSAQGWLPRE